MIHCSVAIKSRFNNHECSCESVICETVPDLSK